MERTCLAGLVGVPGTRRFQGYTMSDANSSPSGILAEMTIDEVEALDPDVVLFGLGSTEPHGPHLPYGTDVFQTEAVCRRSVSRANSRGARALMYPTLPIGNNVNFTAFPFACRISVRTLMNVVLDIVEALESEGIRKVVVVNGHGGNTATLQATLREHAGRSAPGEGAFVCLTSTFGSVPEEAAERVKHPSEHAGESETSRMLHLRPDLVREAAFEEFPIEDSTVDELEAEGVSFVPPWHGYMPRSAGGKTGESTAETGKALIDGAADRIADVVVALHEADVHDRFPYPRQS